jgi:hypothetical protein
MHLGRAPTATSFLGCFREAEGFPVLDMGCVDVNHNGRL